MRKVMVQVVGVIVLMFALGCESDQPFAAYQTRPLPQPQGSEKPLSIALNSPALNQVIEQASIAADGAAWYDTRNDYARATYAGQRTAIIEHSYTRVHDRQFNTGNRVHNHYSEQTWSRRTVRTTQ